jgi:ABC-type uncharacterized transport system substrate-binding protein
MSPGRRELLALIGAASVAHPARAQPKAVPLVGVLMSHTPDESASLVDALRHALADAGYRDGSTITLQFAWADGHYDRLAARAADLVARRPAAIYPCADFAVAGGLISHGPSLTSIYRLLGTCTARILAGAKPADLPVQRSDFLEMVVNLSTARGLGLSIPPTILAGADEVIE